MENVKKIIKNMQASTPLELNELVTYQEGQVVSKTLVQNQSVSLTLFAFDQNEEISSHSSHGDAIIYVIDGTADITIGDEKFKVVAGQTILMPAEIPHAVFAPEQMKFMLTVVF